MLVLFFKYTTVTPSILCTIFLIWVATMHHQNYSGQESKNNLQTCDLEIRSQTGDLEIRSQTGDLEIKLKSSNLVSTARP